MTTLTNIITPTKAAANGAADVSVAAGSTASVFAYTTDPSTVTPFAIRILSKDPNGVYLPMVHQGQVLVLTDTNNYAVLGPGVYRLAKEQTRQPVGAYSAA
ncbi:hypothetical protein [Dokdonella soli]|uniref:Uncharacterized protein n=1 Tax=Dokdonella soli TaxID=529810 RepID=A0ABP3U260_9GAMM